jgi:hypothetical protein
MALLLRKRPLDFHKRGSISTQLFADPANPVDDHHVFPQGYLDPQGVPSVLRDSILNRTLIDKITNIRIGKRPPSDYLAEIRQAWGGDTALRELLESHSLPWGADSPLIGDDFDAFLRWREARLSEDVAEVTGYDLSAAGLDGDVGHPEGEPPGAGDLPIGVRALIAHRASAWTRPLAEEVARRALALDGVELRVQESKGDPWYFQVRHRRLPYVVAYVHPRPSSVNIEYRLSPDDDAEGLGERRQGPYAVAFKVRHSSDVPSGLALLKRTLSRPR